MSLMSDVLIRSCIQSCVLSQDLSYRPAPNCSAHHDYYCAVFYGSLVNTQSNSRVIFVNYRSVRTVPLFHVSQRSRELAERRYGLPSPNTLLFDPTINSARQCEQWPYPIIPKFWHVFESGERIF